LHAKQRSPPLVSLLVMETSVPASEDIESVRRAAFL